jgi:hypothetical protein
VYIPLEADTRQQKGRGKENRHAASMQQNVVVCKNTTADLYKANEQAVLLCYFYNNMIITQIPGRTRGDLWVNQREDIKIEFIFQNRNDLKKIFITFAT